VKKRYQIATRAARDSAAVIEQFCQANGQVLLPLVSMMQSASEVVETVIHEIGVRTLETILVLGADQVAGPRHGHQPLLTTQGSHWVDARSLSCRHIAGD
jgi:hypothetical protein